MSVRSKWQLAVALVAVFLIGCAQGEKPREQAAMPEDKLYSMPIEDRRERFEARSNDAVHYENPSTGYTTDYTLDVEYNADGSVERINFPNGGWQDHFVDEDDNGDGTVTVTTDDGKSYTVPKGESIGGSEELDERDGDSDE